MHTYNAAWDEGEAHTQEAWPVGAVPEASASATGLHAASHCLLHTMP